MKTIDIKLNVEDEAFMTDATRGAVLEHYDPITQNRLAELWDRRVPARERLSIEVSGTCVTFMDDWVCIIFGKSYTDCIRALGVVHNFLVNELQKQATFRLLLPEDGPGTLDELLARERRRRRIHGAVRWTLLSLVTAGIGYALGLFQS